MKILLRPVAEISRRIISSFVGAEPCVFEQRFEFRICSNRKQSFDRAAFSSCLEQFAREPAANQHAERINNDRLPGSSLTGKQIETTLKLNLHVID